MPNSHRNFYEGQLVIYMTHGIIQLGRIKHLCDDGKSAFVWYHTGCTAAKTDLSRLYPIDNTHVIKSYLGGEEAEEMFGTMLHY